MCMFGDPGDAVSHFDKALIAVVLKMCASW